MPFYFQFIQKLTFTTYETSWYSKTHFYKIFNISPWVLCWEMTRPVIIFIESCIFTLFTTNRQQYTFIFSVSSCLGYFWIAIIWVPYHNFCSQQLLIFIEWFSCVNRFVTYFLLVTTCTISLSNNEPPIIKHNLKIM